MSRLIKNPNKLVGDFHIKSSGDQNPIVKIENINDNNKSAQLHFKKTTASTAANDTIGSIRFLTTDSNDEDIQTASITSRTVGITEDSEAGSLIGNLTFQFSDLKTTLLREEYFVDISVSSNLTKAEKPKIFS